MIKFAKGISKQGKQELDMKMPRRSESIDKFEPHNLKRERRLTRITGNLEQIRDVIKQKYFDTTKYANNTRSTSQYMMMHNTWKSSGGASPGAGESPTPAQNTIDSQLAKVYPSKFGSIGGPTVADDAEDSLYMTEIGVKSSVALNSAGEERNSTKK